MSSRHRRRSNGRLDRVCHQRGVGAALEAAVPQRAVASLGTLGRPRMQSAMHPIAAVADSMPRQVAQRVRPAALAPPAGPRWRRTASCRRRPRCRAARRGPLRSSAEATTWAHPGGVRTTTRLPELVTSATHSPITRRRWSSGRHALGRELGDGVHRRPARHAHLDGTEILEVARHGRLGGGDALRRRAARRAAAGWSPGAARSDGRSSVDVGPCSSGLRPSRAPTRKASAARGGVEAVVALLEHDALRAVDHVGRDLEPAVGGQAVHEHRRRDRRAPSSRLSTVKPSNARRRASLSSSCPIDTHVSVWTAWAPATASIGRVAPARPMPPRAGRSARARPASGSKPGGQPEPDVHAEHRRHLGQRAGDVVVVADVGDGLAGRGRRGTAASSSASASACSGCDRSLSMLTTGTLAAAANRSTIECENTRAASMAW